MKREHILKMVMLAMLVAIGVVISPILRVEGMCPMAHLINIVCSVFLGPWYSLLCATLIGIIRMTLMGIPPLALTGAVFGAFLSGVFYRLSGGKILCAVLAHDVKRGSHADVFHIILPNPLQVEFDAAGTADQCQFLEGLDFAARFVIVPLHQRAVAILHFDLADVVFPLALEDHHGIVHRHGCGQHQHAVALADAALRLRMDLVIRIREACLFFRSCLLVSLVALSLAFMLPKVH